MKRQTFEAGEKVIITVKSQIICERNGKYLVKGFGYPISAKDIKKTKQVKRTGE